MRIFHVKIQQKSLGTLIELGAHGMRRTGLDHLGI